MSKLPKRYRFDNHAPVPREPAPLPVERPAVRNLTPAQPPQVIHVHQAPPDRIVQRLALGAGIGGGVVAGGVIFLPLLIQLMHALVAALITVTVMAAVSCWAIITVVGAVSGRRDRGR